MKMFLTIIGLFISTLCFSQIQVIQFNANWNNANSVNWLNKLSDCKTGEVDIVTDKAAQAKYKIIVVPTIIVFNQGEEVKEDMKRIEEKLDKLIEKRR